MIALYSSDINNHVEPIKDSVVSTVKFHVSDRTMTEPNIKFHQYGQGSRVCK